MKNIKVFIKEEIVQSFNTEITDTDDLDKIYDEIREKYRNCELVTENPEVLAVYATVYDGDKEIDLGDLGIY